DLLHAMQALSQLSYGPTSGSRRREILSVLSDSRKRAEHVFSQGGSEPDADARQPAAVTRRISRVFAQSRRPAMRLRPAVAEIGREAPIQFVAQPQPALDGAESLADA